MFNERLRELRKSSGLSQEKMCSELNKKYGLQLERSMISKWETGFQEPQIYNLVCIADFFGVPIDYLTKKTNGVSWNTDSGDPYENYVSFLLNKIDRKEPLTNEENQVVINYWNDNPDPDFIQKKEVRIAVKIPVLGYVRAGIPIDAVEEILDYEEITEDMANTGTYFCLQIKGDSMEPKFSEGDVVVIRQQETVENGDIAVVLINGNDATIKKFYRTDAGIQLVATNPSYDPLFYTPKEVDSLPVSVIGKVVELRAKF